MEPRYDPQITVEPMPEFAKAVEATIEQERAAVARELAVSGGERTLEGFNGCYSGCYKGWALHAIWGVLQRLLHPL